MKLFNKKTKDAITEAREDERLKCDKDKNHALEMQKIEIEGIWSLALQKKNAELQSMSKRLEELRKREKDVMKEKYRQRSQVVLLKQVLTELHTMSEEEDMEKMERSQLLGRLKQEIENIKQIEN